MQITIDQNAGFCTGVERSVRIAQQELDKGKQLYCLGEIIHNEQALNLLRNRGLQTIGYDTFRQLKNARVLIRAHGEPPETYRIASENNITLIDTTCHVVSNLQKQIRENYARMLNEGAQVVIFGKQDHPEIVGLNGQVRGTALIISLESDLQQIDFRKPVLIYVQTTFNQHRFDSLMRKVVRLSQGIPEQERGVLMIYDTMCKQVKQREKSLGTFCRDHDVILFVSDPKSSNGNYLFSICQNDNPSIFFITGPDEIQAEWFTEARSVGITGATSTPLWLLQSVAAKLTEIVSSQQD
ncbi:MAG TPA: 4-hydroxy-3-methylbut-2-enyl diphosphate reductase [Bacteroidales bacterium]|nr:4-hydroxy-3-methylbut-2-enyl diphosphate reductase [Bacteroidales bacterium]HNS46020.1 4-hydroxy-3-methylbut-2-enyl diphosphate reductase [Bacteroidales bacterium]